MGDGRAPGLLHQGPGTLRIAAAAANSDLRPMWYLVLKLLHVIAAIAAVGANITYGIWIAAATREGASLPFALRIIKRIDDRLANPAYGLLLVTGAAMVVVGGVSVASSWLLVAFALYVALVLVGVLGYTPALKAQIRLLESRGSQSPEYAGASRRGLTLGAVTGVLVLLILALMVLKPALW